MESINEAATFVAGKINNHTLFEKEGVRVVVIAIRAGDQLKPHSAPVDVLIVGIQGEAEIMLEGEHFHMTIHKSIKFPAKAVHSVKALTDFKMLLIK